ncbi:MAG: ribbon-helix-helix protein, CopG family [Candidatus Micrarchaeota archaeon]|nr:ribbon-helix-helix protein, CopG family [Candidatus Micrarchaeota archaeon]
MAKKRISLTIDADVLKGIDELVDDVNIRSRSEAIESIIRNYLKGRGVAVFLAGGNPASLKIRGRLKPLLPFGDKLLIEHNLEELRKNGFSKAIIIGKSEVIGEIFKKVGDGERFGIEITYVQEKKTLGNAKTLQLARKYVHSSFLVLPIDNYFRFDISGLVKSHMAAMPVTTLAIQASREYSTEVGFVEMAGEKITSYEERPKKPRTFLTALFIGMYSPDIFDYIPRGDVKWVLQSDVFPKLIQEGELNGYLISGVDVNIEKDDDIRIIRSLLKNR